MKYLPFTLLLTLATILNAQDIVILHTNDLHSHLNGLAPESEYTPLKNDQDPTLGGFSRIAGYINSQKEIYGDKLLVVDAGDFLMGTLFQTLETNGGFQLNLMKEMGFDFCAIGNHEFDFGANMLAKIITDSKVKGEIPQLLCSNYRPSKMKNDDKLLLLFENETILPYSVIEKNGLRIGLLALIGEDAEDAIPGDFGVRVYNIKQSARKTARMLKKKENVDLVIALSHAGVEKNKHGEWDGEDVGLANVVPEIDLVISGHTHTYLAEPIETRNGPVVQTGCHGSNVGSIEIELNGKEKPIFKYALVKMDDMVVADENIQKKIDEKAAKLGEDLLKPIATNFSLPVFETGYDILFEHENPEASHIGPMVSDAVYFYLNEIHGQEVDISIVANGVVRHSILKGNKGLQNINDIFNIMPIGQGEGLLPGSPLGKIYITGNELKKVMELILTVYPSMYDYYLFFSGMQIIHNPDKGLFRKISEIIVGDDVKGFQKVDFSRKDTTLYGIAANKYILGFIGKIKKMSFGIVNVTPKDAEGKIIENNEFLIDTDPYTEGIQEAKEWLALYYYLKSFDDTNGNGIPDMPDTYKNKVNPVYVSAQ
ncbi:MAG: bifunctional metallophosphatase/5'-nucleotidase [Prolixibacteraceae bacterium]|nr:bifunctional metallophosphatase/5'-nucleotidase [Prolixibacteraceae bacterium]